MSQKVNLNVFLHSLLVIKKMNEFTVIEAKDVLLREHAEFTDSRYLEAFGGFREKLIEAFTSV